MNKINFLRKGLTRLLTRGIGSSANHQQPYTINKEDIKRVLICRPNHRLGNQLLITPMIREVMNTFPNAGIDLFVKGGIGTVLFRNYDQVEKIIMLPKKHFKELWQYLKGWTYIKSQNYDLVINFDHTSSSGRISTRLANGSYKFFGEADKAVAELYEDHRQVAKYPVYGLRHFLRTEFDPSAQEPVPGLDLRLDAEELARGKEALDKLTENSRKTICIFTFGTGAKCYSESWWEDFHSKLKEKFSAYNIVEVLPVENVSKIAFRETAFYSRDVREIGAFIANAEVFIGADSGIMHLASSVQTPTVGLFSVTDPERYAPYDNGSLAVNTNEMDADAILKIVDGILEKKNLLSQEEYAEEELSNN